MLSPFGFLTLIPLFRPTVTLILGIVLFLGCLGFALVNSVGGSLLNSDFYLDNLAENDVYNRIYDVVLLDKEFADTTQDLMGGVQVPQQDIVGVAKEIIPPAYLQDQVEGAVRGAIDYVNKDTDDLLLFIDLRPSLERIEPTLLGYIDRRIDELQEVKVDSIDELERELETFYRLLEDGKIQDITQIPAIEDSPVPVDNYADAFEGAFATLDNDPDFPRRALDELDERSSEIKGHLGDGRVKDAVKASVRGLASPLIDNAVAELKKDLDYRSRLDLVQKAAEQNGVTKEEFLDRFDFAREVIGRGWVAKWLALVVIAGAGLMMAAVQLPRMASALRFPGIALFFSGVLVLALGLITRYQLLKEPLNRESADAIPPSLVDIINDLSTSMASDVGSGVIMFSIIVIVIGLGLALGSFFVRTLHIPFLSR